MKRFLTACLLCLGAGAAWAQASLLEAGPMVGYATMREVMLWAQTKQPAIVHFEYYATGVPDRRYRTASVTTDPATALVAHLRADSLTPGEAYTYELFINGQPVARPYALTFQAQPLWQWRTDPPTFRFAVGSCTYINDAPYDRPGRPYGGDYRIFGSILADQPDFMLWLGDNVYLREADWNSRTGIFYRYGHARANEVLQPLLGSVHHYAIWDDHDYGPNDSDRSYWLKETTAEAFRLFWPNPNTNMTGQGGITGTFSWGDAQFFLLDDRYFRTPNRRQTGERHILGEAQVQWLIDALVFSRATFKFVVIGGQVLSPAAVYENYATYPAEREALLRKIREHDVEGVIFLTGDRHHTELTKLERPGTYPLYDLTCSPLTAGTHAPKDEGNTLQVENTLVSQQNYGILEIRGPRTERVLRINIYDKRGEPQWEYEIRAADLRRSAAE